MPQDAWGILGPMHQLWWFPLLRILGFAAPNSLLNCRANHLQQFAIPVTWLQLVGFG
jgi:hypothetical protein